MTPERRRAGLIALLLVVLAGAAAWNVSWMRAQRARAQRAAADLATSRRLGERIAALRDRPQVAAEAGFGVDQLGERIERARRRAGLNQKALEGVFPQAGRRLGASPYRRKPIALTLRPLRLERLVVFLHHLTDAAGLRVRELRLTTPTKEAHADKWAAEATITYLVYDPGGGG